LTYPELLDKVPYTENRAEIIRRLEQLGTVVRPQRTIRACEDPDDNKFIEAAVEGGAKALITKDKHLLKLNPYEGIEILPPEAFIEKMWMAGFEPA